MILVGNVGLLFLQFFFSALCLRKQLLTKRNKNATLSKLPPVKQCTGGSPAQSDEFTHFHTTFKLPTEIIEKQKALPVHSVRLFVF